MHEKKRCKRGHLMAKYRCYQPYYAKDGRTWMVSAGCGKCKSVLSMRRKATKRLEAHA